MKKVIPRYEDEVIAAEARKHWHGDTDKVATTSLELLKVDGVIVQSRYCKADELETMRDMIEAVPMRLRRGIATIWCNSKATHSYSVTLRVWNEDAARQIGVYLEQAALQLAGGHNGIDLSAHDGGARFKDADQSVCIDPNWDELDL